MVCIWCLLMSCIVCMLFTVTLCVCCHAMQSCIPLWCVQCVYCHLCIPSYALFTAYMMCVVLCILTFCLYWHVIYTVILSRRYVRIMSLLDAAMPCVLCILFVILLCMQYMLQLSDMLCCLYYHAMYIVSYNFLCILSSCCYFMCGSMIKMSCYVSTYHAIYVSCCRAICVLFSGLYWDFFAWKWVILLHWIRDKGYQVSWWIKTVRSVYALLCVSFCFFFLWPFEAWRPPTVGLATKGKV